jgi:hypothetical protein
MGRIAELVHRGVRVIVGNRRRATSEIPAGSSPRSRVRARNLRRDRRFASTRKPRCGPVRGWRRQDGGDPGEQPAGGAAARGARGAVMASLEAAGVSLPQVSGCRVARPSARHSSRPERRPALRAGNGAPRHRQEIDAFVRGVRDRQPQVTDAGVSAMAAQPGRRTKIGCASCSATSRPA